MKDLKHVMLQLEEGEQPSASKPTSSQANSVAYLFDNLEVGSNKAKLFRVLAEKMEVCID